MLYAYQRWATFLQVNRKAAPVIRHPRIDNCGPNQKSGELKFFGWHREQNSQRCGPLDFTVFMTLSVLPHRF